MNHDTLIPTELIDKAEALGACRDAIAWLREQPHTWAELIAECVDWYVWGASHISNCPIDLTGLCSRERAQIMVLRTDCPVDLTGLDSRDRAWVMVRRPDCPVNLSGLADIDRAWVEAKRPDCHPN